GIRRRLAPLVERDRRRIELLNSLLLSMPGTPTLYYGDEIGMGDNIFLGDRHGVRTPMQWSDDRNGGFSRADPASLIAPTIMDPLYGFQAINVEAQAHDTHSLLNWTRRMLAVRKQQKAFGRGNLKMLAPANRRILAYLREYTSPDGVTEIILCVANMSRAAQASELDLSAYAGKIPVEMIGGTSFPAITKLNYLLTLPPYGFYWFLLADDTQMPNWYVAPIESMPELRTVIIKQDLFDLLQIPAKTILEQDALPTYLPKCSWFTHPGEPTDEVRLGYVIPFGEPENLVSLVEVEVRRDDVVEHYFLPLGVVADHLAGTSSQQLAVARLRQKRVVGLLTDAFTLPEFSKKVIQHLRDNVVQPFGDGELHFTSTPLLKSFVEKADEEIDLVAIKDVNGSVVVGGTMVLKPIRKLTVGIHPEIEISSYLSECKFPNIVPLLGEVKRVDEQGNQYTLMILQAYMSNQGDAWQWTQNTLERVLRDRLTAGTSSMDIQYPAMDELETFAQVLGNRLAEMHNLLAKPSKDPRFGYVDTKTKDTNLWVRHISERFHQVLTSLQEQESKDVAWLNSHKTKILSLIKKLASNAVGGIRIRTHGNLHLAQILVVRGDAYFINFEDGFSSDEPELRLSPLKDVADILCAFDDAGATTLKAAQGIDTLAEKDRINQIAISYRRKIHTAFYGAYKATAKLPHVWQNKDSEVALLKLACIDNRLREIIKAAYRPDWLEVPVQGLVQICEESFKLDV
ncbi:MAG: alpha-amylase, partial [Moraxellaceae bacterium]